MLDWKKRRGTMRDRVDNSVDDVRTYFGGPWLVRVVGGLLGVYLLVAMLVGWYWSQEPDLFPVQQDAQAAAERAGRQMVTGYTTVETLKEVVDTLLTKPGGYISNDIFPPGIWMDNMPSWEYGVLVQVRDISRALRKDFARSQSQSTEDATWPAPSRASTSTTRAGRCRRPSRSTRKASSRWTATWPGCPTRTSRTRSSTRAPTT